MLSNLAIENDVVETNSDTLPSERSRTVESGIYDMKINLAYLDVSKGGATCMKIEASASDDSFKINQTYWLTSGTAKGAKNYYLDKDGNKRLLPGMAAADHLSVVLTGKHLAEMNEEEKVVKMWSFESRKEVPTKIRAVTDFIGKPFQAGVLKKVENRRVRLDDGNWGPSKQRREFNEIDKAFSTDGLSATERLAGATKPEFRDRWQGKWEGVVDDKYDASVGVDAPDSPASVAAPALPAGTTETKPLFE